LDDIPKRVVFYLEGPPARFELKIKCVETFPVSKSNSNSIVSAMQNWSVSDKHLKGEANRCRDRGNSMAT